MADLIVDKLNEVFMQVHGDFAAEEELHEFFSFNVPGARYTPKYKARMWDGKIRLFNRRTHTLYCGLADYLIRFCESHDYTLRFNEPILGSSSVDPALVEPFLDVLKPAARGEEISFRDYQVDAIKTAIESDRCLLLSPTGSGKSLIIYALIRWHLALKRKTILIVPTTSLVEQMHSDFQEYANGRWSVNKHCQRLYSGFSKQFESDVLITTWQSIYKQPKDWFNQFDVVIGDEAHQFKAASLKRIMECLTQVRFRIGTTGTIDNTKVNQLQLEGVFGPIHKVTTTKQLIDNKKLTPIKITGILLQYPDEVCKAVSGSKYQKEIEWLVTNPVRNRFISKLSSVIQGNTLILFQFVEKQGIPLYEMTKALAPDKTVLFIHGGIPIEERELIRKRASTEDNVIIIASYGTCATGINIPSIENIIFASPSKGKIRNLQSIGRGLRLKDGKVSLSLYDIGDDLHWKKKKNFAILHAEARYILYAEEQFPFSIREVRLNNVSVD